MKYIGGSHDRAHLPAPEPEVAPGPTRPSPGKVSLTSRLAAASPPQPAALEPRSADPMGGLGPGSALDPTLASLVGSAYGHDFSSVRVHTDPTAAFLARQHDARAFTVGSQIVFGANRYQPRTPEGDALIAHELAHVAQQSGTTALMRKSASETSNSSSSLEQDADRAAAGVLARLYGGTKAVFQRLAANAGPALRAPAEVQRCTESAADRTRTRLNELGNLNDTNFRSEVGGMSRAETEELLGNVSPTDQAANANLLNRIRTERLVSTAESLIGDLYWTGGSYPDPSQGFQISTQTNRPSVFGTAQSETNTNDFATWVRRNGQPPEPDTSANMNCWEAVIYSGYRAGVIPFSWIANVHQQAASAGQTAANAPQQQVEQQTQQRMQGIQQRLQTQLPLAQQQLQQTQTVLQQLQTQLQQLQGQQGPLTPQQQQQIQQLNQQIPLLQQRVQQIQQGIQQIQQNIQVLDLVLALPQTRARIQQLQQQLQGAQPSPQTQQLQQELQQLLQSLPSLEQIEQSEQQSVREELGVDAYYAAIQTALGVNGATAWDPNNPVPRGDLVFFDGLSHVALSTGNNELVSLWLAPLVTNAFYNNMQRTTIQDVVDAMQNDLGMQNVAVTHTPNPW